MILSDENRSYRTGQEVCSSIHVTKHNDPGIENISFVMALRGNEKGDVG